MTQIIDRRNQSRKKSQVNRQRFLNRYRRQIKHSVDTAIQKRAISDIDSEENIIIPHSEIDEPRFQHAPGGLQTQIFPGNHSYVVGDKIKRPQLHASAAGGDKASNQGLSEDDFIFTLTKEEFLDLYFNDLELPDLIRKQLTSMPSFKKIRAGTAVTGVPTNINIVRTMRQATGRRLALSGPSKRRLAMLEAELAALQSDSTIPMDTLMSLTAQIAALKNRLEKVPFIDPIDLRYNNRILQSRPTTQAVMFCIMDVSGSMDEIKKEISKRFFILLYLFLKKSYEKIDLIFIRHHTSAKEVSEKEFFYSRETGGTVVSSALELLAKIIRERYPTHLWNIYVAQASDGDNWNADSPRCQSLLEGSIVNDVQYYAYVEIMPRHHQSLWHIYQNIAKIHPHFAMQNIDEIKQIYPVFRKLFQRKLA